MPLPRSFAARPQIAFPGAQAAALSFMRGTPTPTQTETTALLAAMTVQPSAERAALINDTIFQLKNAGLWAILDFLHVVAAHDAQAARINWVNPAQVATVNSTPTFTVDRGYVGNGTDTYLGTAQVLNALTNYKQDNAHIGVWVANDGSTGSPVIGCVAANIMTIVPRQTANINTRLNNGAQTSTALAVATSKGHGLMTRSAAAGYDVYKDGSLLGNVVQTSAAPGANTLCYLRSNILYNGAHQLAAGHGGSSLNPTQIGQIYSIIGAYMAGVGV